MAGAGVGVGDDRRHLAGGEQVDDRGNDVGAGSSQRVKERSVASMLAFGSMAISSTPMAVNQNGDTSRIEPPRRPMSGRASSSVQYGTQASRGMSGFEGGVSSLMAT